MCFTYKSCIYFEKLKQFSLLLSVWFWQTLPQMTIELKSLAIEAISVVIISSAEKSRSRTNRIVAVLYLSWGRLRPLRSGQCNNLERLKKDVFSFRRAPLKANCSRWRLNSLACLIIWKWFELKSNIPLLKKIVWVTRVLRGTAVGHSRFDNLRGSNLHSQNVLDSEDGFRSVVETSVANNSPFQNSSFPDDLFQSSFVVLYMPRGYAKWKKASFIVESRLCVWIIYTLVK